MSATAKGIVATGHPVVSQAAMEILELGGNAYDATIAAGFTSAVAEPTLTSLGGGGFLLARTEGGRGVLYDFFTNTPGKGLDNGDLEPHFFPVTVKFSGTDQDFNIGMGSVAVPGTLKGFLHVHDRLGKLPLKEIVAPAIRAARQGVTINVHQAHFLELLYPIMTLTDEGKNLYSPTGSYLFHGDIYHNHDLADFLEQLPEDHGHSFYEGRLAQQIDQDMLHGQGLLTGWDLNSYEVIERDPLTSSYRGRRLLTNPPPSFGGVLIAMALQLLERLDLSAMQWGTPEHVVALVEVMQGVDRLRESNGTDIDEYLEEWQSQAGKKIKSFSRGTTHISVVDCDGNVAAMTTSNGEGSGYIVPGTGIMLNNMMGEDDLHPEGFHASPPGQRVASMMSPSILLKDNEVELVLGSGGSKRIRTVLTQVISHTVDFNLSVVAAVNAPRIHWDGATIQIEPGFSDESREALAQIGTVNEWAEKNVYFGGVHAAMPNCEGAGDPRRGGSSLTLCEG